MAPQHLHSLLLSSLSSFFHDNVTDEKKEGKKMLTQKVRCVGSGFTNGSRQQCGVTPPPPTDSRTLLGRSRNTQRSIIPVVYLGRKGPKIQISRKRTPAASSSCSIKGGALLPNPTSGEHMKRVRQLQISQSAHTAPCLLLFLFFSTVCPDLIAPQISTVWDLHAHSQTLQPHPCFTFSPLPD